MCINVKIGQDAFVNAWDVANKVSDLLMVRMNQEVAPCAGDMSTFIKISESIGNLAPSTPIFQIQSFELDKREYSQLARAFSSKFARYCFMREFLDGMITSDYYISYLILQRSMAIVIF